MPFSAAVRDRDAYWVSAAVVIVLTVSGCQGSWADQTIVHLDAVGKTAVKGLAIVSIGKACDDEGNCRYQGSNIMLQLTAASPTSHYRFILARGECSRPPARGPTLAYDDGDELKTHGTGGHVDVPIHDLTNGTYVISVITSNHEVVACGVIRRSGPF
jgi:hypothetical protein